MALDAVGRTSLSFWAEMLRRADRDFASASASAASETLHVRYDELVADPIATVKRIYASFGWDFTPAYEGKLVEYIARNKAERKAKGVGHSYSLEQLGLSKTAVAAELSWYVEKYLV